MAGLSGMLGQAGLASRAHAKAAAAPHGCLGCPRHVLLVVAERLPEQTIQEDPNLLMYYDISLSRV